MTVICNLSTVRCCRLARLDVEDGVVGGLAEGRVEGACGFVGVVFVDHETHIDFAGALGDHADVDVADGGEDLGGHAAAAADVVADQADQRLPALVFHVGQAAKVGGDGGELFVGVDGERDRDFGGGDHVDRALVLVEDVEDGLHVAVGHQHAAGDDIDDGELLFDGDGLEGTLAGRGERGDAGALAGGVAAVEDENRNVPFDGGEDGGRVQDLGAEVGQLGGFLEADDLDAEGLGADAGVGGHDAVDVGPDFDGLGLERAADKGAGEVGAAAAEGGGDAGQVGGDEAGHDRHLAQSDEGAELFRRALVDDGVLGDGFLELRVGDDDVAGVDVGGVDGALAEGGDDDAAGDALAVADDEVGDARGEFEDGGEAAQDFVEGVELPVDQGDEGGGGGWILDQGGGGVAVARAQARTDGQGAGAVADRGSRGGAQELVSNLGHS